LRNIDDLAQRLGMPVVDLRAVTPKYREFTIPKRGGGTRRIAAPEPDLKELQRKLLRRVLARLRCHPAATGFERNYSIVINALGHVRRAVIVRMDIQEFFTNTKSERAQRYFEAVGWNREAAEILTRLCTFRGGLPQGAPTSPRLSNLVNRRLDSRLESLARRCGALYSRYADDLTFSWTEDRPASIHLLVRLSKLVVKNEGYTLHDRKKLSIARRHDRQVVTGLVVNERINLPRKTRRWLRALRHHVRTGRQASLNAVQLAGWQALQTMIQKQRERGPC
jgi:hypothetical protein